MSRKISVGLLLFILFLIVFDAVQQKYYIDSFSLAPEGAVITLGGLLKQHFIRWLIWGLVSIPTGWLIWKNFKNGSQLAFRELLLIGAIIFLAALLSLLLISSYGIWQQNLTFSPSLFTEFFVFFTFQKGLTFLLAHITLSLLLYNHSREKTIESQFIEIKNLKRKSTSLEEALNISTQEEPHLNIKTGHRVRPIPLSEVIWIQSDDYCVKIHTEDQAFTLRKSMKSLEEQLRSYGFIRVHRVALLNLNFLHQVNFDASTIRLINTTELPLSKTGAKALKKRLEQSAI